MAEVVHTKNAMITNTLPTPRHFAMQTINFEQSNYERLNCLLLSFIDATESKIFFAGCVLYSV